MRFPLALIISGCLWSLVGCTSASTEEMEMIIRDAEMAAEQGDMISAGSIAQKITKDKNHSGLSARQLGRLSIVYMLIADSLNYDDNLSQATECYRQAFLTDSVAADSFYRHIGQETFSHARMLATLVSSMGNAGKIDLLSDTIPVEYIPTQADTDATGLAR